MTAIDVPLPQVRGRAEDAASTTHRSQCTLCEAHCGIQVTVTDGQVSRIEGNPDDVLSKGYICPKATAMGGLHTTRTGCAPRCAGSGTPSNRSAGTRRSPRSAPGCAVSASQHGFRSLGMYLGNPAAHSSGALYGLALRIALLTPNFYLRVIDRSDAARVRGVAGVRLQRAGARSPISTAPSGW